METLEELEAQKPFYLKLMLSITIAAAVLVGVSIHYSKLKAQRCEELGGYRVYVEHTGYVCLSKTALIEE